MADIQLKSLTFSDLPNNKYIIPEIDDQLETAGKAADAKKTGDEISELKSALKKSDDAFTSFAYGTEYLTQFADGTYKWYALTLANGTKLQLKMVSGNDYNNGELLLYNAYAGTQLGTIYPTVVDGVASFTVDKDNVTYIRTGANFSHGAANVFKVVDGENAEQQLSRLNNFASERITNIKHVFGFEFGDVNSSGQYVASQRRMATPNIQHFDYNVIIPRRTGYAACAICTYSGADGSSPNIVGPINTDHDYQILAGTYFRLYIYNPEDTTVVYGDKYNNVIYNSFCAFRQSDSESFVRSGSYKDTFLYNRNVQSVCHRGASRTAPENTLPAFIAARKYGFDCVEADVAWTHDNVAVLLHDSTINRTSNGEGNIADLDYDDIKDLDFGSWFSAAYTGTKIPTVAEFLALCRKIGLRARLDLNHTGTQSQLENLCATVVRYGMKDHTEFVGYNASTLNIIKTQIPTATLIYLVTTVDAQAITDAASLKTSANDVHITTQTITDEIITLCANALIPLEYWTAGTAAAIINLDPYITAVTVEDTYVGQPLVAGYILYNSVMLT